MNTCLFDTASLWMSGWMFHHNSFFFFFFRFLSRVKWWISSFGNQWFIVFEAKPSLNPGRSLSQKCSGDDDDDDDGQIIYTLYIIKWKPACILYNQ